MISKKRINPKIAFSIVLTMLLVPFFFQLVMATASSSSYTTNNYGTNTGGSYAASASLTGQFLSNAQGSTNEGASNSYMGNIGFFGSATNNTAVSITSYSIYPQSAVPGSIIRFGIVAEHAQAVWANITLPNSTKERITLENNGYSYYTAPQLEGNYQITFYANDSSGALASVTSSFTITTTITSSGSSSSSGSGGGGNSAIITRRVTLDKEQMTIKAFQGDVKSEYLTLTNHESSPVTVNIYTENNNSLVEVKESVFELAAGETKGIRFQAIVSEETPTGLYLVVFKIKLGQNDVRELPVSVEVTSKNPLLDVKLSFVEESRRFRPGEDFLSKIELFNLGKTERVDITMEYVIKDQQGTIIYSGEETLAVNTQISYLKSLQLPKDIPGGTYILYIKATYNGNIASASQWFVVVPESNTKQWWIIVLASVALGISLVYIIIMALLRRGNRRQNTDNSMPQRNLRAIEQPTRIITRKPVIVTPLKESRLSSLYKKKIYGENGLFIGLVKEILLEDNRVYGLIIEPTKDFYKQVRAHAVMIRYKHVASVGDVILLKGKIEDYLNE